METKEVIASMLVENTGRHFLDSGDAYGRHWQRANTALKESPYATAVEMFDAQSAVTWNWGPIINVFHFLVATLDYNEKLDRAWHKWVFSSPEDSDRYINGCSTADEFIELLEKKGWAESSRDSWYGGGWVNTYNHESCLSQGLQFVMFQLDPDECPWAEGHEDHVLLSIHGGADVRGGYTALRAFKHYPEDSISLFDDARVTLYCDNAEDHREVNSKQLDLNGELPRDVYLHWESDNAGYDWYGDETDLQPIPVEDDTHGKEPPICPLCKEPLAVGGAYGML